MGKRIFSVIIICVVLLCSGSVSFAAQLPEKISAPQIYTYYTDARGDGAVCVQSALPQDLQTLFSEWNADAAAFKAAYGIDQLILHMQFDWSVDSSCDWHYTPEWDNVNGTGFLSGPVCAPCSTLDVFSGADVVVFADEDKQPLFADWLTDGQRFDYNAHTLYLRARYVLVLENFDAEGYAGNYYLTSAWSDVRAFSPQTAIDIPQSLPAPEISALAFDPVEKTLTFDVQISDELFSAAVKLLAATGRNFSLVAQVRTNGGSWTDAAISDEMLPIVCGKRTVSLPSAIEPEGLYAEFRMRYVFVADGTGGIERNVKTPWSGTSSYGQNTYYSTMEMNVAPIGVATCGLCHNCSAPVGICLYIWLGVILAACVAFYIVIVIRAKRRPAEE